jgi:hypothetical protein
MDYSCRWSVLFSISSLSLSLLGELQVLLQVVRLTSLVVVVVLELEVVVEASKVKTSPALQD